MVSPFMGTSLLYGAFMWETMADVSWFFYWVYCGSLELGLRVSGVKLSHQQWSP